MGFEARWLLEETQYFIIHPLPNLICDQNLWHVLKIPPPAIHIRLLNRFQSSDHCLLLAISENVCAGSAGRYSNFKFVAWNNRKWPCFQTIPCSYDYVLKVNIKKLKKISQCSSI